MKDALTGKDSLDCDERTAIGVLMAAPQSGSPMTYLADGRQYIVVAISGGSYSGEYVAFTLPAQ